MRWWRVEILGLFQKGDEVDAVVCHYSPRGYLVATSWRNRGKIGKVIAGQSREEKEFPPGLSFELCARDL